MRCVVVGSGMMKRLGLGLSSKTRRGCALAFAILGGSIGVGCGGQALIEEPDGPVALTGGARSTLGTGGAFSSASGGRPIFPGMGVGGTITNPGPMKGPPIPVMPPIPVITPRACPAGRGDVALFLAGTIWGEANFASEVGQMLGAPVQEVVKRMFSDVRAQQGLRKFTLEWFGLPDISMGGSPGTMGSAGAAGSAGIAQPSIDELMIQEGQRYVLWSLQDGQGSLDRLFNSPVSMLNERLATYYAVPHDPASGSDVWNPVDMSSQERFGILTRGFWLSRNLNVSRRGSAVMQDLLCTPIPPPPQGFGTHETVPPPQVSYQALRQQTQDPSCQGCHSLMDPAGVAFEHFSGVGRYQPVLGNQPVDASGYFTHSFGAGETAFKFQGAQDYTAQLAASQDVQMCLVKKVAAYTNLHTYGSTQPNGSPLDCALQNNFLAGASVAEAMRSLFSVLVPQ